jgi:hypothetical protein
MGTYELNIVKCKILQLIEITSQTHYVCIKLHSRCHILLQLRFVLRSVYKPSSYDTNSYLIVLQSLFTPHNVISLRPRANLYFMLLVTSYAFTDGFILSSTPSVRISTGVSCFVAKAFPFTHTHSHTHTCKHTLYEMCSTNFTIRPRSIPSNAWQQQLD